MLPSPGVEPHGFSCQRAAGPCRRGRASPASTAQFSGQGMASSMSPLAALALRPVATAVQIAC